jgi:hypothetical protein
MAMEGLGADFLRPAMITQLWRGELALWKTFWLFGAGGGQAFGHVGINLSFCPRVSAGLSDLGVRRNLASR